MRIQALAGLAVAALLLGACESGGQAEEAGSEATADAETSAEPSSAAPSPSEPSPTPSPTRSPTRTELTAEDVAGRWCPAPDSEPGYGCVSVDPPHITYEDGSTEEIRLVEGQRAGCFSFDQPGAPFGDLCPAGMELDLPDYYPGEDRPEQERIWNSQTAVLLVRDEG